VSGPRRWFAFLRAINTGGRRLRNEELLAPFRSLGLDDVAAYQAAGNVTFLGDPPEPATVEAAIVEAYGFHAPVFLRTADQVRSVVDDQPFSDDELAATEGRIQVTFLRDEPSAATRAAIGEQVPGEDHVVISGTVWYWLPVAGISSSQLPVATIERLTGPSTTRTLGTLERMVRRFAG
jgi:uncharacterized protein (DUF1697 family)